MDVGPAASRNQPQRICIGVCVHVPTNTHTHILCLSLLPVNKSHPEDQHIDFTVHSSFFDSSFLFVSFSIFSWCLLFPLTYLTLASIIASNPQKFGDTSVQKVVSGNSFALKKKLRHRLERLDVFF